MLPGLLLAAAVALPPADAVHAFIETLQSDRPLHGLTLGAPDAVVVSDAMALSCIHVRTWRTYTDDDGISVDVDAEGLTALGRRKTLPRHWRLKGGKAYMLEEIIAIQLLAADSDDARGRIVETCPDCDRENLSIALADLALDLSLSRSDTTTPSTIEATEFAREMAADAGSVRGEVWALRVFGFIAPQPMGFALGREAVALAERRGTCDDLAGALFSHGNTVSYGRDRDEGGRLLREAASLAERVDNPRIPLKALHNFSSQQLSRGRIASGMDAASKLAELASRYGWSEGEAAAWLDLGEGYASVQRTDLAMAAFQRAFNAFRACGNDRFAADALFHLARCEEELGHYRRAIALNDRAIALNPDPSAGRRGIAIAFAAATLAHAGQLARAESRLREAEAIGGSSLGIEGMASAAEIRLAQHRLPEAVKLAEEAIHTPTDMYGDSIWRAQATRARALLLMGRRSEAKQAFRETVRTIESRRVNLPADAAARQHYFAARSAPYHALLALLVSEGRAREALAAAERLKARTLLDTLGSWPPDESRQPAGQEQELSLERIPPGAAVIEIVVARDATTIFVVRNGRTRVRRIAIDRAVLSRMAEELNAAIASRRLDYARFAESLGNILLRPITGWIAGARRIYVIPDDALWRVPFGVLPTANGEPLVADHEIALAPSIRMIGADPSVRRGRLIAFGNPAGLAATTPLFQTVSLPHAATEIASIGRLYPTAAEIYSGAEANEATFKRRAPTADIIHIAAHAAVSSDWPMESSLLLAAGGRDDGELEAQEILSLRLHCSVAVLAGCNTGGGQFGVGEGMLGLSWAFLASGARNAVVSQWNVDSRATERLMVAFHRALAGGATPPAALRQAALSLRRDPSFAHPFYWGAFVVIGSGR
jgi:CHAT domain-containing protein